MNKTDRSESVTVFKEMKIVSNIEKNLANKNYLRYWDFTLKPILREGNAYGFAYRPSSIQ